MGIRPRGRRSVEKERIHGTKPWVEAIITAAPCFQVVFAAREFFDSIDEDKDGKLNANAIGILLTKLWERMERPIDTEDSAQLLESETEQVIQRFDTTGDRHIAFREFLSMICLSPWRLLLPIKVCTIAYTQP